MKMTKTDFDELKRMLDQHEGNYDRAKRTYIEYGLTLKRYCFDCLYAVKDKEAKQRWFDKVYQYLDDTHIYTALKRILLSEEETP